MMTKINNAVGFSASLLSLFTGMGAVAASSCCALPLALSVAGFGGAWLGGITQLAYYRPYFLTAAAIALTVSWILGIRRWTTTCTEEGACVRPKRARLTYCLLGLSTLLVSLAATWSWIEPSVMAAVLRLA